MSQGCLPREGEQLPLEEYLGEEAVGGLRAAEATWYSVAAPNGPGAGCDKCAQRGGSGGNGHSSSFNLLEERLMPGAVGVLPCQGSTWEPDG